MVASGTVDVVGIDPGRTEVIAGSRRRRASTTSTESRPTRTRSPARCGTQPRWLCPCRHRRVPSWTCRPISMSAPTSLRFPSVPSTLEHIRGRDPGLGLDITSSPSEQPPSTESASLGQCRPAHSVRPPQPRRATVDVTLARRRDGSSPAWSARGRTAATPPDLLCGVRRAPIRSAGLFPVRRPHHDDP